VKLQLLQNVQTPGAEGGTGLGLAIATLSVEQLGGKIELSSEVGKGSHFQIILSAARSV
jgi:signal transduction histidine kinase